MLYNKSTPTLTESVFKNPPIEYRASPFWSWNCRVTKELIKKQLLYLKEMGFSGGQMHSRTGMDVPYLSDEFMELVRYCVDESKKDGLLAWIYDEDRFPSGAAGGIVTKTPQFRQRTLLLTTEDHMSEMKPKDEAVENGEPYFCYAYDIVLNSAGELASYRRIEPEETAVGTKWYTYCCPTPKSGWYNNETYVDTLSKEAMDRFISVTHERYKEVVGDEFGKTIRTVFTDEPQFAVKGTFAYADSRENVRIPWTPKLEELYREHYDADIANTLPELFWNREGGEISLHRYRFHDFVCELFTRNFADNCGDWCQENGLSMTGHMYEEPTLHSQTAAIGEAMRSYRRFQIPGVDMLSDWLEYSTAKQAQSAVHQFGREGMLSELYGVTDWDFDFRGHKNYGDWQAALGVTLRVPHLSWMSMYGEAKRDYPASIFYQSPWYREYPYIENHFARLNTALTRGEPVVDIAVIHPVESYWVHWGPSENTGSIRNQLEKNFSDIIEWLLFAQLDFDFISESLLPEQFGGVQDGRICVGHMKYSAVVVPAPVTLRQTTVDALSAFEKAGGTVIFMGDCPEYVGAVRSDAAKPVYAAAERIPFSRDAVTGALEKFRRVGIRKDNGHLSDDYFCNYRRDTDCDWLFICHGKHVPKNSYGKFDRLRITIAGEFTPVLYDTLSGKISNPEYEVTDGKTVLHRDVYAYDSLLLRLMPYDPSVRPDRREEREVICSFSYHEPVRYRLSEPNALLVDTAEYRVDSPSLASDGEWLAEEELLRVNDIAARIAGLPAYNGAQPWTEPPEVLTHHVDLRFRFTSEIVYEGAYLAIENADMCEIILNGEKAPDGVFGYFTDESIGKRNLPAIREGENELLIRTPIGVRTKVEWCYIMGDFGVRVCGCRKTVTKLPEKLGYSDITSQGLPFYTGNIDYVQPITTPDCFLSVRVSEYRGALVRVFLDGKDMGVIAFDPFTLDFGKVSAGDHTLTLRLFGTRYNAFGALHNADTALDFVDPGAWRTSGCRWCYEYRLRPMGITASPVAEILM